MSSADLVEIVVQGDDCGKLWIVVVLNQLRAANLHVLWRALAKKHLHKRI